MRTDSVKTPLQSPYEGPFKVIEKNEKHFKIIKGNNEDLISIDRCKPAYLESESAINLVEHSPDGSRVRPYSQVKFSE